MMSPEELQEYKEKLKERRKLKQQWKQEKTQKNRLTKALRLEDRCAQIGFCKFCYVKNPDVAHLKSRSHFQRLFKAMLSLGPETFAKTFPPDNFILGKGGRGTRNFFISSFGSNQTLETAARESDDYKLFCYRSGVENLFKCEVCNYTAGTLNDWMKHINPKPNHREAAQKEVDRLGMEKYLEKYPTVPVPFLKDKLSTLPGVQRLRKQYPSRFDPDVGPPAATVNPEVNTSGQQPTPAVSKPAVAKPAVTTPTVLKPALTKPGVTKPAVTTPPAVRSSPALSTSSADRSKNSFDRYHWTNRGETPGKPTQPPSILLNKKDSISRAGSTSQPAPNFSQGLTTGSTKQQTRHFDQSQQNRNRENVANVKSQPFRPSKQRDASGKTGTSPSFSPATIPTTTKHIGKTASTSQPPAGAFQQYSSPSTDRPRDSAKRYFQQDMGREVHASKALNERASTRTTAGTSHPTAGSFQPFSSPPDPSRGQDMGSGIGVSRGLIDRGAISNTAGIRQPPAGYFEGFSSSTTARPRGSGGSYYQQDMDRNVGVSAEANVGSFQNVSSTSTGQPRNLEEKYRHDLDRQTRDSGDRYQQGMGSGISASTASNERDSSSRTANISQSSLRSYQDYSSTSTDRPRGSAERYQPDMGRDISGSERYYQQDLDKETRERYRQQDMGTGMRGLGEAYYQQDMGRDSRSSLQASRVLDEKPDILKQTGKRPIESRQEYSTAMSERPIGLQESYYQQDVSRYLPSDTLEDSHGVKRRRGDSSQEYIDTGTDRAMDVSRFIPSVQKTEEIYDRSGQNYRSTLTYDYKHEQRSDDYTGRDFSTMKGDIDVNPSYGRAQDDRYHADYKPEQSSDYMGQRNTRAADNNTAKLRYDRGGEHFPRDDRTTGSPSRDGRRRVDSEADERTRSSVSRSDYTRPGDRDARSGRDQTERGYRTSRDVNEASHVDRYYQEKYDRSSSLHPGGGRDDRDVRDTQASRGRTQQSENTYYGYR